MAQTCPNCGQVDEAPGRFCRDCGTALAASCPSCGAATRAGQRFCADCGTALGGTAGGGGVATDGADRSGAAERRVCSVLFCDLVGFTPLSESRDPEEVRELLSRYFATARTVIERYGGVVEKFIGDAVMAVWGTPVALEGDTERAVRAGLDLIAAVQTLGGELGAPTMDARGGVVTGEVAVTLGATYEGMVAGDAVNTAARVQSVAGAGTVLVDAATRRLAQVAVEFVDAGVFELKGKGEPQQLWRAGRVLSNVGGAQRVDGLEAPLTGRDLELRLIKDLFHAAVDRRQPRLVTVTGAAGIGKSRLGWEFEKYIDGLATAVWWHRGRCLSYGDGVSFWALAEILRQRLDIAEEDPVDVAATKLQAGVERYITDPDERGYIGVRLGRLLGVKFDGDAGQDLPREELFAGWRLWFERLAASQPVVLVVEDLHYADEGLLDFLDHLLDWSRDAAIFVLASSRPEMRVERAGWGTGRNRTLLALEPLDGDAVSRLLDALVPGIPADAAAAITAQAQGIPLFAVETIRTLIDRDVVVPRDGVYRLEGDLGMLTVPDSLHSLLAARLDALDPSVRALVADASVLGSTFPAEALIAISGQDADEVRAGLADLVRREVFEISADPLSPQRGNYGFSHDMLRQVAYDTLSRRDRKARHLTVAEHLRSTFPADGDEVSDVIASHYLDALAAVPDAPDTERVRGQAVAALIRAGERATRTGGLARGAASFAQAAELTEAADTANAGLDAARLWERAAVTAIGDARWEVIIDYADRAERLYTAAGERRAAARARAVAGRSFKLWGRLAEARERLVSALQVLSEEPDADTVTTMVELAGVQMFAGDPAADQLTADTLTLAQTLAVPDVLMSTAMVSRGIFLTFAGRLVEATAYHREGVRLAEESGDASQLARALLNLADTVGRAHPAAARDAGLKAVELLRRSGERGKMAFALINVCFAQLEIGQWGEMERMLASATEVDGLDDDTTRCSIAWLAALRGDIGRAEAAIGMLRDLPASEDHQDQATLRTTLAFVAAARSRPAEALGHARQALGSITTLSPSTDSIRWVWGLGARAAHECGDLAAERDLLAVIDSYRPGQLGPILHAERELCVARLAAAEAKPDADEMFAAAVAELRERSTPYHLAHGLLDHADFLRDQPDRAAPLIAEARRLGEQLGAASVLRRIESYPVVAAPVA
jgi:class 3 adenylate cyclase/tetratricopeptide (TPR) repeat protein